MDVALGQHSGEGRDMGAQEPQATRTVQPGIAGEPRNATVDESGGSSLVNLPCGEREAVATAEPHDEALMEIRAVLQQLAESSERYHTRAEQRESVIDHLRGEVERLRRGERRSLLRPLLVEICRLRNDLLRQADGLPDGYDAEQAARLLRSYAESVELALESSGVVAFEPDSGIPFDPRMHRSIGTELTGDPALAGRVARVWRSGYLDVDANSPIAAAEVVLFVTAPGESGQPWPTVISQPESATVNSEVSHLASGPRKRDEL